MPVYTYRREDGTTFDFKQKFTDDPLAVDPITGQRVQRVVHAAGVIFKGQGFYVNDSRSASKATLSKPAESTSDAKPDAAPVKDAPASAPSSTAAAAS